MAVQRLYGTFGFYCLCLLCGSSGQILSPFFNERRYSCRFTVRSIVLFIVAIMSFVWRTTPDNVNPSGLILSHRAVLIVRVALSGIFVLGLIHGILVTSTFRNYGEALDKDWDVMISDYQKAKQDEEGWSTRFAEFVRGGNVPLEHLGPSELMYLPSMSAPTNAFDPRVKAATVGSYNNPVPITPGPMMPIVVQWDDTSTTSSSSHSAPSSPKPPRSSLRNRRSSTNRSRSPWGYRRQSNDTPWKNSPYSSKKNSFNQPERSNVFIPPLLSPMPSRTEAPSEILSMYDSPSSSPYEIGHNGNNQRRARFREPLVSVQDSASVAGSIGPGVDNVEMMPRSQISSQPHTQPSTSSASGVTPEMASAQGELRLRRRPVHAEMETA